MGGATSTRNGGVVEGVRRVVAAACLLLLTACGAGTGPEPSSTSSPSTPAPAPAAGGVAGVDPPARGRLPERPNVVLVVMDDFSMDLVGTMRSMARMRREGATYRNAFVVDSLCCVARASLMTGQYPHQTGVRTNTAGVLPEAPLGGWAAFEQYDGVDRAVNVALQEAGYTTGFVGKYLNEYEYVPGDEVPPVPPGWSWFRAVFGSAYDGWDFDSTRLRGGRLLVRHHDAPPASAPREVKDAASAARFVSESALDFIEARADDEAPWFLEVAPYAPHNRTNPQGHYPGDPVFPALFGDRPSRRNPGGSCGRVTCAELTSEGLPGFGDDRDDNVPRHLDGTEATPWNTVEPRRATADWERLRRDRARMARSIDRMVQRILDAVGEDTFVVLTSDNGLHLGQQGLGLGKGTAYATDVQVPLYVVGPGVVPGPRDQLVSDIDLAPTLEDLAGLPPRRFRSGRSFERSLVRPDAPGATHVFHEHTGQVLTRSDPDMARNGAELDRIPSYVAVRSRDALLVRLDLEAGSDADEPAYEFYSYDDAAWERTNTVHAPRHREQVESLLERLDAFDACTRHTGPDRVPPRCRRVTGWSRSGG
jgi:N-acetylglucosamine-6-sulfatase